LANIVLRPKDINLHEFFIIEVKALSWKKKRTKTNLENLAKAAIS